MKSPLILVAEDDPEILIVLLEILELEGYRVHSASDGQAAWDYINAALECPAILITDIMMPRMTGLELMRKVRTDDRCWQMPILVCSASGHHKEEVIDLGGDFATKPFDIDQLLTTVNKYLTKEDL